MASPTRNKLLVFIIGILLLSNIALVGFFIFNRPEKKNTQRDKPGSYMSEALRKEVGFDDQQMAKFEQMAGEHRQQMRPLFEDITKTKENFYSLLAKTAVPDSSLKAAAAQIGDKQEFIDLKIFNHFQNIRHICTPSQQPAFDSLIQRVVHRMISPMRRGEGKRDSVKIKK